jgi:photosystem II stability/assembly factor-like uncharacterized protein
MVKRTVVVVAILFLLCVADVKFAPRRMSLIRAFAAQDFGPIEAVNDPLLPRDPDFLKPQRLDAWQIIGPGGGGTFHNPSISPHDPNLVFASTDMSSCFVSENGGHTWREFNFRYTCHFLFDPKRPNRVYAMTDDSGFWRSDDRGHTWSLVYPDPAGKPVPRYHDNESGIILQQTSDGSWPWGMSAAAIDPDDGDILYISVGSQLWVSKNAGKTWKTLALDAFAQQIFVDPSSPREKRVLYMTHNEDNAIWDGAKYTGKLSAEGRPGRYGVAFGTPSAGGKPVMYGATLYIVQDGVLKGGGILATGDGGKTWRSLNEGLLKLLAKDNYPEYLAIGTSRHHAEVIYVSFGGAQFPNDSKTYFGMAKSSDGGATWTIIRKESDVTAENMHESWVSRRFGPDWGDRPLYIGVDDNNPDLVYTGDLGRIMRSRDGGQNWDAVYSQSTGNGYTTTGLDVTTCYGVHFDPFDNRRMFITYTDIGLFRSEDGGESWVSSSNNGVPFRWKNTTYWVEFDPAVKGKMWAVMTEDHDLPLLKQLRFLSSSRGGALTSLDGGKSWKITSNGLPENLSPTHILLDPKSSENARVLYLAAFGGGVFKSSDGGQHWVAKNRGLPEKEPLTWRMALDKNGILYVVTTRRSEDGNYGNDQDGWLFRSTDGADSWQRVALPAGLNGPNGITVDPEDPQRLYLSAWGRYKLYDAATAKQGGVFLSTDGGQHWENVLDITQRIYDVTVDPRNLNVVYAAGSETAAYRSVNRGKTWSRIAGFNFRVARRVIPDPVDSSKIYITTFGSSVWHGPAEGDPNALEDIVAPRSMMFQVAGAPVRGK